MKKKVVAFLLMIAVLMTGIWTGNVESKAAEELEEMPVSYLLLDDALVGYAERQTWGVYLMSGYSSINDAGGGRIGCGGQTNAARRCTVSINVVIERKVDGSWVRVTSFSKTSENALTVTASKYLSVTSGYYYRARSAHYAGSDSGASYTNALLM